MRLKCGPFKVPNVDQKFTADSRGSMPNPTYLGFALQDVGASVAQKPSDLPSTLLGNYFLTMTKNGTKNQYLSVIFLWHF